MLDVRCLPNPFYIPELKDKWGWDEEVVGLVMGHPEAKELLRRYESFLECSLPLYVEEGKGQLSHCSGLHGRQAPLDHLLRGKSRSIAQTTGLSDRHSAP